MQEVRGPSLPESRSDSRAIQKIGRSPLRDSPRIFLTKNSGNDASRRASGFRLLISGFCLLATACAKPTTQLPPVTQAELAAEAQRQRQMAHGAVKLDYSKNIKYSKREKNSYAEAFAKSRQQTNARSNNAVF